MSFSTQSTVFLLPDLELFLLRFPTHPLMAFFAGAVQAHLQRWPSAYSPSGCPAFPTLVGAYRRFVFKAFSIPWQAI
jgi:hypothetical protein